MEKRSQKKSGKNSVSQHNLRLKKNILGVFRHTVDKTSRFTGHTIRESTSLGKQVGRELTQKVQKGVGKVQRKMGEDFYSILRENPLITNTISRSDLIIENRELLRTAFNIPWVTTLLWSAAGGSVVALQGSIAQLAGQLAHYGPGHLQSWDAVNKFMDSVSGSGHRLKFGHSIKYLPKVIEKFGIEGVPAYFLHIAQDFMTVDGIPVVPNAWEIKKWFQKKLLSPETATQLVSISFSSVLAGIGMMELVDALWKFTKAVYKQIKVRKYIRTANAAIQSRDYNAAIENHKRVLEIERDPVVLVSLGQLYMQRASNRLRAHQALVEAVKLLAPRADSTIRCGRAKLSARGVAGTQALATADVLAGIHPEHWSDHVQDLVNATVFSFTSTAHKQMKQSDDLIPDTLVTPACLSAAINYYLAAKSACYYPLAEQREETLIRNLQSASQALGLMAQFDEESLRQPADLIKQIWIMELLPPNEIDRALGAY